MPLIRSHVQHQRNETIESPIIIRGTSQFVKDGHGDIENGCPPCECDIIGSIGEQCDAVSGQCTCKQGVFGKRCNQCRPSYFNFTDAGCQFCHCNIYGSMQDGKCNNVTGKCECRENVDGTMCEKCATGFFNITSGTGCQRKSFWNFLKEAS
ncbi:laminin EGF-like protein [Dictyocaulus viviparus]|uniref:Laminin EGF-like protein n=1 Tax=Dictyocaulus viviparus TaxID=29172 RepID=A0A0D8Y1Q9_DICVI|nr:laminin EGF-like protein [Dictyocaulus viviparus]